MAPNDVAMNIGWGELFAEKYNRSDAAKSFQAALKVEPDNVQAKVGMATPDGGHESAGSARRLIGGSAQAESELRPRARARTRRWRSTRASATRRRNRCGRRWRSIPNSLEARSIDAAIAFLEDRTSDFNAKVADILKINPRYGEVYRLAAEVSSHNYHYIEAARFREARRRDRTGQCRRIGCARSAIAAHRRRAGRARRPRARLQRRSIRRRHLQPADDDGLARQVRHGPRQRRRRALSADEAPVMREHVVPFAKESIEKLSKQWDFKPKGQSSSRCFPSMTTSRCARWACRA